MCARLPARACVRVVLFEIMTNNTVYDVRVAKTRTHMYMYRILMMTNYTPREINDNISCLFAQAQRQEDLPGLGERGGPLSCHLHATGR